jgi:membrane-associated phospholipid phosphatase
MIRSILWLSASAMLLQACADQPVAPGLTTNAGFTSAVKQWESNAAIYWTDVARALTASSSFNAFQGIRGYSVVALAQYNAAIAAENGKLHNEHPSVHAAISSASVVALSYLFPSQASNLEIQLQQYLSEEGWPGEQRKDVASGEAIGRTIGTQVVDRAKTDRFFSPVTVTVPTGPGRWFSATPPAGAGFSLAKTYFLETSSQFRPEPHPAFNSPEFIAALTEVRQFADTRTAAQDANAKAWNLPPGTHTPAGYWNQEATTLAANYHLNELATAKVLALMNMVSFDAVVASHEAKYFYWLLRPTMADPGIVTSFGNPNFPSYPSNHAAISAGMASILGASFPSERARLDALAENAALSRVEGGIHYRFDGDAGVELGRKVAAWALANSVYGHEPFVPRQQ